MTDVKALSEILGLSADRYLLNLLPSSSFLVLLLISQPKAVSSEKGVGKFRLSKKGGVAMGLLKSPTKSPKQPPPQSPTQASLEHRIRFWCTCQC